MGDAWAKQWYEPTLEATPASLENWSSDRVCQMKVEEILDDWKTLAWGLAIPRRLGGSATGAELSKDKKFFRKAINLERNLLKVWHPLCPAFEIPEGDPTEFSPTHQMNGAQMVALDWTVENLALAIADRATVVTVAMQLGLDHWASRAANAYNQEITGLTRLLDYLNA